MVLCRKRLFGTPPAQQPLVMGLPFLKSPGKRRDQVVAIDLGARTTKAVHIQRRGDKMSLVNYALIDAPSPDQSLSVELLGNHIKDAAKALGPNPRNRQVSLAISVGDSLFRHVELPLMPVNDMRQMLKFNSKNYLQQDLPDYVFDCCYILQKKDPKANDPARKDAPKVGQPKQKVALGGAKRQIIDEFQNAIKLAGLIPDQIVPAFVGPVNSFEMAEPEVFCKEVVAIVEIGFKNSTIVILDGGELMLSRVVAIGGDKLTGALAEGINVTYVEAENIKVGMPAEVQPHLESALHPLGRELRASIDFFENQNDRTVGSVYLSGGSARSEFVVQTLQNELMVPCKSWNPSGFMHLALEPEKMGEIEQVAPQLSVVIGAALSGL
jgi:type IV pilus assembly protein PilM